DALSQLEGDALAVLRDVDLLREEGLELVILVIFHELFGSGKNGLLITGPHLRQVAEDTGAGGPDLPQYPAANRRLLLSETFGDKQEYGKKNDGTQQHSLHRSTPLLASDAPFL